MRFQRYSQIAMHGGGQPGAEPLGQGLAGQIFRAQMRQLGGGNRRIEFERGEGIPGGELTQGKAQHQRRQQAAAETYQHVVASIAQAAVLVLMFVASLRGQVARVDVSGNFGGRLTVPVASPPQTLNPLFGTDATAKLIASLTQADLMHINPRTLQVEAALATTVEHRTATR